MRKISKIIIYARNRCIATNKNPRHSWLANDKKYIIIKLNKLRSVSLQMPHSQTQEEGEKLQKNAMISNCFESSIPVWVLNSFWTYVFVLVPGYCCRSRSPWIGDGCNCVNDRTPLCRLSRANDSETFSFIRVIQGSRRRWGKKLYHFISAVCIAVRQSVGISPSTRCISLISNPKQLLTMHTIEWNDSNGQNKMYVFFLLFFLSLMSIQSHFPRFFLFLFQKKRENKKPKSR